MQGIRSVRYRRRDGFFVVTFVNGKTVNSRRLEWCWVQKPLACPTIFLR